MSTKICSCILTNHWQKNLWEGESAFLSLGEFLRLKKIILMFCGLHLSWSYSSVFSWSLFGCRQIDHVECISTAYGENETSQTKWKTCLDEVTGNNMISKNPTFIFYHCRSLNFCECVAVFVESLFHCFGFCVHLPEQVQKFACCLFVCLNRWSSFPPQINLNHFARRQNRISQRTKQVFQGTLQHGQTVFYSFLRNQI